MASFTLGLLFAPFRNLFCLRKCEGLRPLSSKIKNSALLPDPQDLTVKFHLYFFFFFNFEVLSRVEQGNPIPNPFVFAKAKICKGEMDERGALWFLKYVSIFSQSLWV